MPSPTPSFAASDKNYLCLHGATSGDSSPVTRFIAADTPPDVRVSPDSLSLTEGGSFGSLSVSLSKQPVVALTVLVEADDDVGTASRPSAIVLAPRSLIFKPSGWATPQSVLVLAREDGDDRHESVKVLLTADGKAGVFVRVSVADDESPGLPPRERKDEASEPEPTPATPEPIGDLSVLDDPDGLDPSPPQPPADTDPDPDPDPEPDPQPDPRPEPEPEPEPDPKRERPDCPPGQFCITASPSAGAALVPRGMPRPPSVAEPSLDLSGTGLTDLAGLAGPFGLRALNLNDNPALTDLSGLAALASLQALHIQNIGAADLAPLAHLTALRYLSLGLNPQITDLGPLAGLASLRTLRIDATGVADLVPLAGLWNLRTLTLSLNPGIENLAPLAGLGNLRTLRLSLNPGLDDLSALAGLSNLHTLLLRGVGAADLSPLAGLSNLRHLSLDDNPGLTDLSGLATLTSLQSLHARSIGASDLAPLAGLSNLRYLDLTLQPGREGLAALAGLGELRSLLLRGADAAAPSPQGALASPRHLMPEGSVATDLGPVVGLPLLEELDVRNVPLNDMSLELYLPALEARGVKVER